MSTPSRAPEPEPLPPRGRGAEEWLAVALGFVLLGIALASGSLRLPSFVWVTDAELWRLADAQRPALQALSQVAVEQQEVNLLFILSVATRAIEGHDRQALRVTVRSSNLNLPMVSDARLRRRAAAMYGALREPVLATPAALFKRDNVIAVVGLGVVALVLATIGIALLGGAVRPFAAGFAVLYLLTCGALVIAGNMTAARYHVQYVLPALAIGLLVGNLVRLPSWLRDAVRSEYYLKPGLVLLGAGLVFDDLVATGALALVQAVLVVGVVWMVCFQLARRLRLDDELAVMLASAVSICGPSAAMAACGAIGGDRRKLAYVTSLVLVVALPMLLVQPWIARVCAMPDVVAGAWLGGTLDTSGSVVAAGALLSEAAMRAGVVVKSSQALLVGIAAFALATWWTRRHGPAATPRTTVIWQRFPAVVVGVVGASFLCSFVVPHDLLAATQRNLFALRTVWFTLAFTCIGLETRFADLAIADGARPAAAFVGAQIFNLIWTLLLAYLLFGGVLFSAPTV